MRALLLIDHGSRKPEANALLLDVVRLLRAARSEYGIIEAAHLEIAEPSIADGYQNCVDAGATEVVAVPYFLSPGRHATEDVPRLVREAAAQHEGIACLVAEALGPHTLLAELVITRARDAHSR